MVCATTSARTRDQGLLHLLLVGKAGLLTNTRGQLLGLGEDLRPFGFRLFQGKCAKRLDLLRELRELLGIEGLDLLRLLERRSASSMRSFTVSRRFSRYALKGFFTK